MTRQEAKKLKVGDRVQIWARTANACTGTVAEWRMFAIRFEWDDGQSSCIHVNDMENVEHHRVAGVIFPKKSA